MEFIVDFLVQYGYLGMLFAAFLAGSFFPFSSEAVMVALIAAGLAPMELCIYATAGNVLGGMFNYGVGRMGKLEWIEKYLHVKKKDLDKAEKFMAGRGAWMGFFAFLPLLGSAITIMLGLMRANIVISTVSITIGKALRYVLLAAGMGALTSCTEPVGQDKPVIMVTIEPLRFFAEEIGGDRFKVVTMVPQGSSPETYEPTARQMAELNNSQLYIKAGNLGFERTWNKRLQANAPHLICIDSSDGIIPISSDEGPADPHVWTSPDNALVIAQNIYRAMVNIDGKDSIYFKENLERLYNKIRQIDNRIMEQMEKAGKQESDFRGTFVIYHPTLTYFSARYGLEQLAIEENGREPSAQKLKKLMDEAKSKGARVMFVQKEFSTRNTEAVCKETGVEVVEINPLSYDWETEMNKITEALCRP